MGKLAKQILEEMEGRKPLTRFAPSPTGYLHLGHVVNAIYVWGIARALGGKVILRMEDHDRNRCKPEYEKAILEDLAWLGLDYDLPEQSTFTEGRTHYRQSDCNAIYEQELEGLRQKGKVYYCDCSRKSILARAAHAPEQDLHYDGFCRLRGLGPGPDRGIRMVLTEETVDFHDLLLGPQSQTPISQCGDLPLKDRKGNWNYQFAVVVDDLKQNINLVIRGTDILTSTGRQILLFKSLGGQKIPSYLHHGLLTDSTGRKLSKRDFDADIHSLMLVGEDPEMVLGEAAFQAGLLPKAEKLSAKDLPGLF